MKYRCTESDWIDLHYATHPNERSEPTAATTAELDELYRNLYGPTARRYKGFPTRILDQPIVEIQDWPDWMK